MIDIVECLYEDAYGLSFDTIRYDSSTCAEKLKVLAESITQATKNRIKKTKRSRSAVLPVKVEFRKRQPWRSQQTRPTEKEICATDGFKIGMKDRESDR